MPEHPTAVAERMRRVSAPTFGYEDLLHRRDRKVRNQRIAAAVVSAAFFAAVAVWFGAALRDGGGIPADRSEAKAEFVKEAGEICQAGQAEFRRRTPLRGPRGDWSLARRANYYRKGLEIFTETAARLRSLAPPRGLEQEVDRMLDPFERHLDTVAKAVAAAESRDRHAFQRSIDRAFGQQAADAIAAFAEFDPGMACP